MSASFESLTAKAHFIGLSARAADLRRQIATQEAQARNPIGGSVVDIGIGALVPYGLKGTARRFASRAASNARLQRVASAHEAVSQLISESRSVAAHYALIPANPSARTQSGSAAKWLGASLDTSGPEARLVKLEQALRRLTAVPLLENSRIAEYHQAIRYEKAKDRLRRLEPHLDGVVGALRAPASLPAWESRLHHFSDLSPVKEPLEGALRSLGRDTPEDFRQGLNSIRVALDALIESLTGKNDWKEGVSTLVAVEEERKVISSAHHYLSRASHHGTRFDKAALVLGIDLFVSVGSRLIDIARMNQPKT